MPVIEVESLVKKYAAKAVVDGISFSVEEGEIFGILGHNGAGKTTTVECVAGLREADGGRIQVLGMDPHRERDRLREQVGIQLQESELPGQLRVWEALDLYASFYRDPADWERLLADLGLTEKRNDQFRRLSGGQKQRLSVALALVGRPRIAILDELTTGLDPQARRDTWQMIENIRAQGVTVVLVTHFMEEAERLCDRVAVFDQGRVLALDTPAGLVESTVSGQTVRFRPSEPLDEQLLTDLPEVAKVQRRGETLVVEGTGNLLHAVTALLARKQIVAHDLRVEQPGLDDAYVALTGRNADE